ncbi:hypothetical protein JCM11251_002230 [Rhodosporidiobolus azoricus]
MSRPTSLKSYDSSRYDEVDDLDLPEYPSNEGGSVVKKKAAGGEGNDSEEDERLIEKEQAEQAPAGSALQVDVFAYQLRCLNSDLLTLSSRLTRLLSLVDEVHALEAADTSLTAQSLLADLATETAAAADLLAALPGKLQTAVERVSFLKPASGRFILSAAELSAVKASLAQCGDLFRGAVKAVEEGLKRE